MDVQSACSVAELSSGTEIKRLQPWIYSKSIHLVWKICCKSVEWISLLSIHTHSVLQTGLIYHRGVEISCGSAQ